MTIRCTQSACRREFTPGPVAPVRCPYCGHHYPRIPAISTSRTVPFGYGLRIDPRDQTAARVRQCILQEISLAAAAYLWGVDFGQPFLIDARLPLRDAQRLCLRLSDLGIGAQVTTQRHLARAAIPVLRVRRR